MTMDDLVEVLHKGKYTLAVCKGDEVRTFCQRGVSDLATLLRDEPSFLKGTFIADKVVGKAAAALMLKGGVARLHTDVLSKPAYDLFIREGFPVEYACLVSHVENRTKSGWCPLERLCFDKESIDDMVDSIYQFITL